jgi:hypothetical protein
MKKVFFLIAFLFTVVCHAAPPPDEPTSFLTEDVGCFRSHGDFTGYSFEVQEVTFEYLGDKLHSSPVVTNKPALNYGFINRNKDGNPINKTPFLDIRLVQIQTV